MKRNRQSKRSESDTLSVTSAATGKSDYERKHLFVLIHGFAGNPSHLEAMKATLLKRFPADSSDVDVYLPNGNAGLRSFDGIKLCAERIIEELALYLAKMGNQKVRYDRISIVGYSLGGLYARYVVGILYSKKFFDKVQPVIFTTFASPHLGSTFHGSGFFSSAMNFLGGNFLGVSGNDMFANNSEILNDISDPSKAFLKGLKLFKHLMLFANAVHDRTVPFFTSYITNKDPFKKRDFVDFEFFPLAKNNKKDGPDSSYSDFLIDMEKSRYRTFSNGIEASPTGQERQFQVFITMVLPLVFPVVFTLTSVTTLVSRYRVREAQKAKRENRSQLINHQSHSEGIAELAYYAIDDALFAGPQESVVDSSGGEQASQGRETKNADDEESAPLIDAAEAAEAARGAGRKHRNSGAAAVGLLEGTPQRLTLRPETMSIMSNLDELPWEKYAVKLKRIHSHAEIVNRRNMPGQGQQLLDFWVDLVESKVAK